MLKDLDKIVCCDCQDGLKSLPTACVQLVVTSPPWGQIRDFAAWDFPTVANELFRVLTNGGVVCWHIQDQIVDGSESGVSSEQRLYFRDLGFRLHQTLIVDTAGFLRLNPERYGWPPQYVFVLSKGKPATFNAIKDVPTQTFGRERFVGIRDRDGSYVRQRHFEARQFRRRGPIWKYAVGTYNTSKDPEAFEHPALMPEALAHDLIVSYSNPGDVVLDPFAGAGTTCKKALQLGRHFVGYEINPEYVALARRRIKKHLDTLLA